MTKLPSSMKRYILAHRNDVSGLTLETSAAVPELSSPTKVSHSFLGKSQCSLSLTTQERAEQILIRIRALSLNARDLQIATNIYPAPHPIPDKLVPVSGWSHFRMSGSNLTDTRALYRRRW